MTLKTLVFLHGYGIRGNFWNPIKPFFESKFNQIIVLDLDMKNIDSLLTSTKNFIKNEIHEKYSTDIYIIGHSMGAALALILAQDLGPEIIKSVVAIAPPFGTQKMKYKKFVKFLIKNQLIPKFLSRPRFFSKQTPKSVQKLLFDQVVPETEEMIDELLKDTFFITEYLKGITQDSLVLLSESDKVVNYKKSLELSSILKGEFFIYPKAKKVAHNDFIAAPIIAQEVSNKITNFFFGKNKEW